MNKKLSFLILPFLALSGRFAVSQENGEASVSTTLNPNGTGKITVEATGQLPEVPTFYTAKADGTATVSTTRIQNAIRLNINVIQGKKRVFTFEVVGNGNVVSVEGDQVTAWSVRKEKSGKRLLDLETNEGVMELKPLVKLETNEFKLPQTIEIPTVTRGDAVGFSSVINVKFATGAEGKITKADGYLPVKGDTVRYQTSDRGVLVVSAAVSGSIAGDVEIERTELEGTLSEDGKSADFKLTGTARVAKANAVLSVLSGNVAVDSIPNQNPGTQLRVGKNGGYELIFAKPGNYPIDLDFVAAVTDGGGWKSVSFDVASGAVAPIELKGVEPDSEFGNKSSVMPKPASDGGFLAFVPGSGKVALSWKGPRKVGEGKLFFSTTGIVETTVGAGLLSQSHTIDMRILQGEIESLKLAVSGPGEILEVECTYMLGWKVTGEGEARVLEISLSQPISKSGQITVRTQTPHDALPVRVRGIRITPTGAVRHSGHVRVSNKGSVRLEPASLSGLTQLAPEQFPGGAMEARQVFVYRFPSAEYDFEIAADRVQPEISVSETVLYQLAETDRLITAAIEFDIREAPIREFDILVPSNYSVVSVTGAAVADNVAATEETDGLRNLKIIFNADVSGRQLVELKLEQNIAAAAGEWILPRIQFPNAKSVRGDIGVVGAAGYRIVAESIDLLAEKPLSYFPDPVANLQQAFRIREPGWSATMRVEALEKSVQADVFHLYSLSEGTAFGSVLVNYFITGAPVSELQFTVPADIENVLVDGKDVRTFREQDGTLTVSLHQPVIGAYTLLVTFEEKVSPENGSLSAGRIVPLDIADERGFLQVVSPFQVQVEPESVSDSLLKLDALELPAEFQLLSSAPSLGVWQYTSRPFELGLKVNWFEPGTTVKQVVEFSDVVTRVSRDGELVTDLLYYVKSKGRRALHLVLPNGTRLWAVTVAGRAATARQADGETLIPLPGGIDPNIPVEVRLRLGKPATDGKNPVLALPTVDVPVLKTEWRIGGDKKHVLVPSGGKVDPVRDVLRPSGFDWVTAFGTGWLFLILALAAIGVWLSGFGGWMRFLSLLVLIAAAVVSIATASLALRYSGSPSPLKISLPVLSAGESVGLVVRSIPVWQADISWFGIGLILIGIGCVVWTFLKKENTTWFRIGAGLLIAVGLLMQRDGAPWFFRALAVALIVFIFLPRAWNWFKDFRNGFGDWRSARQARKKAKSEAATAGEPSEGNAPAASLIAIGFLMFFGSSSSALAQAPEGFSVADSIEQKWEIKHDDKQLTGSGTIQLSGKSGDRFLLLKSPAVLTKFEGEGLQLSKQNVAGVGICYILSIPGGGEPNAEEEIVDPFAEIEVEEETADSSKKFSGKFEFQLETTDVAKGIAVPTGGAAIQKIDSNYDRGGWEFSSANAVKIEAAPNNDEKSAATILLSPKPNPIIQLKPMARDMTAEETQFYVEAANLYVPGPGVVDGRHRIRVRPSQGLVSSMALQIPEGLTVSEVAGPISSWQFDADSRKLDIVLEPSQSAPFEYLIETQRSLDPLPAEVVLAPVTVEDAAGQVGQIALAFGTDAQPEKVESDTLSEVAATDFDAKLLPNPQAVLHQVFRYGSDGGELNVRVSPVAPEVRVVAQQVLSLGEENVVLRANLTAEITRAGLFRLSFPLPEGMEVESLTGPSLHHWSELSEDGVNSVILHLNGKTIGQQTFALSLTGPPPADGEDWVIPRFEITEANRQTGELVIRPTTGIRLANTARANVSEIDPRQLGNEMQGALAYRLLTKDWSLSLAVEKLDPWVTGQLLHEVTLREGQTRTALFGSFNVQNASIRSLNIALPLTDEAEIKTLRATGKNVADLVRTAEDSNLWELQFKRRIVGNVQFRIEYDRRGDRPDDAESLMPVGVPEARQLTYHFAVRSGGRLELSIPGEMARGWQRTDWNVVPEILREAGNRAAPVFTLRAVSPEAPVTVTAQRHSLADALKLRVASGTLTTVVSPMGDQLTAVDLTMEVIQRSSLNVGLPAGGELFSIFVNGESVNTVRREDAWQFHILPGANDRTATVRFVYSVPGDELKPLRLTSPILSVPLENIRWQVIAPVGYEVTDDSGNLQFAGVKPLENYDRKKYFAKEKSRRDTQKQQASELLDFANQLLQRGDQSKARWALNSVANQYALDAASNEDARVQLQELEMRQAVVGLNTRRQRLYLDNSLDESAVYGNAQIKEGAEANPVLQRGALNFRPQELSQILQGNTTEDNAVLQRIANKLVSHQRGSEPTPQAITITLPEEGTVYTYTRPVQVTENTALELKLDLAKYQRTIWWKAIVVIVLLVALVWVIVSLNRRSRA